MSGTLQKRRKIIASFFIASLVILLVVVIYGIRSISAVSFLVEQEEITSTELLRIIRFWCWAFLLSIGSHVVTFATWYLSDKDLS